MYNFVYTRLFPAADAFAALPLAYKLKDGPGFAAVVGKVPEYTPPSNVVQRGTPHTHHTPNTLGYPRRTTNVDPHLAHPLDTGGV